jgi:lipopolysaccharide O-acetyltransferase
MINFFKTYGVYGISYLIICKILSFFLYPGSRLIRFPIYVRGRSHINFGSNLTTGRNCRIDAYPINNNNDIIISFGKNIQINDNVHIGAIEKITICNNVLIASRVYIGDHDHGSYSGLSQSSPLVEPANRMLTSSAVTIGENVWIGEGACILKGTTISEGCIIGAGAVISGYIPKNSICVGSPFKIIKKYNFENNSWEKCK